MSEQVPKPQNRSEIMRDAHVLRLEHDMSVKDREETAKHDEWLIERRDENLMEAGRIAIGQAPNTPFFKEGVFKSLPSTNLEGRLAEIEVINTNIADSMEASSRRAAKEESQIESDVLDARLHLNQHREVYEQAAIEDASKAGYDTSFGKQIPVQPVDAHRS